MECCSNCHTHTHTQSLLQVHINTQSHIHTYTHTQKSQTHSCHHWVASSNQICGVKIDLRQRVGFATSILIGWRQIGVTASRQITVSWDFEVQRLSELWGQVCVVPGSRLLKVLFVCSSANAVTSPSLRHRWLSVSKAKSEADGGAFEVTSVSSSSKDLASRYVAVAVVK